jgi:hypothetical protein
MREETRLRPIGFSLLILAALITFLSFSYFSITPKITQNSQTKGSLQTRLDLVTRQVNGNNDTCAIGRPCKNGACCGVSGYCGYGKY